MNETIHYTVYTALVKHKIKYLSPHVWYVTSNDEVIADGQAITNWNWRVQRPNQPFYSIMLYTAVKTLCFLILLK